MISSIRGFVVAIAVAAAALLGEVALADSLECEKHWKGPDADNSVPECMWDVERLQKQVWILIVLLIPVLAILVTLVSWPIAFIGRLCCGICGSNRRRPASSCCCGGRAWDKAPSDAKDRAYPPAYVRRIKFMAFVLAALSIGCLVVMTVGAEKLRGIYDDGIQDGYGILNYFDGILATVRVYATLPSGEIVPPLSPDAFDIFLDVTRTYRAEIDTFRRNYEKYVDQGHSGLVAISVIPAIFLFIGFAYAAFDVRRVLPAVTTIINFLLVIVYAILSIVFFIGAIAFLHLCTEIELHKQRRPGVIQWWVVPLCYRDAPFADFNREIYDAQRENSADACENMRSICSPSRTYNPAFPSQTFQCDITDPQRQCTSVETALPLLNPISAKTGVPGGACNASVPANQCGFRQCASFCNDAEARHFSSETVQVLDYAERFVNATNVLYPVMDCNELADRLLVPFRNCEKIRDGFFLLGAGTGVSYLLFMYGIVVLFIGQKVYFKLPKSAAELEAKRGEEVEMKKKRAKYEKKGPEDQV